MRKLIIAFLLLPNLAMAEPNMEDGLAALADGDYNTAMMNIQPLALDGDPAAEFKLCGMYFIGTGVPKNLEEAVKWCKLAANHGNVEAMYNVGLFYQNGEGVQADLNEALKWYQLAASHGHSDAAFNLAQIENSVRAAQQYKPAQVAHAQAQPQMMQLPPQMVAVPQQYYIPVQPQYAAPAKTAAVAPISPAMSAGNEQEPPIKRATKLQEYCLLAAQRGNPDPKCDDDSPLSAPAEKTTATKLAVPKTVPASAKKSADIEPNTLEWYIKEAGIGNIQAQNNLGVMYRRGKGVDKDPKEAFKWFEKAAARGSTKGMMNLASMYKKGEGVKQSLELAYSWFNLAADRSAAGKEKDYALKNVQQIAKYMNNQQIGDALNYVTKLDDSIPVLDERTQHAEPATKPETKKN
jgi:hypothetical protein